MISPDDVRHKAARWWTNGSLLRATLDGTVATFFPKAISQIGLDRAADRLSRYAAIAREQEALRQQSKTILGYGYSLAWTVQNSRQVGSNAYITGISIDTLADYLALIGQTEAYTRFVAIADQTSRHVPELLPWVRTWPLRLLDNANDWPHWLAICRFFIDDYVPDRYYVRQLPLPVHTKFIEDRSSLLLDLLTTAKPDLWQREHTDWRRRIGLLVPEPLIRVRALDGALRLAGQQPDFGLPLSAFDTYLQTIKANNGPTVFICENLLNFLTLPPQPNALVIWSGGGFNIDCLVNVPTLQQLPIRYWGDLDAHGFQILNQCRGYFPNTQSLLMDQPTFDHHAHLITPGEPTPATDLPHLTDEERPLFFLLKQNNWRIEQERLEEGWVKSCTIQYV